MTPAKMITKKEWEAIIKESCRILNEAIKAGGSTIKSYHPGKDIDGNFQTSLKAYGKKDEKCVECHTNMRFIKVNGRGTTFCPHCQIKKGAPLKIAITGKIASGKSAVLNIFKEAGYLVLSSDEIVHNLYQTIMDYFSVANITALMVCMRFSASSNTFDCGPRNTLSVTSISGRPNFL